MLMFYLISQYAGRHGLLWQHLLSACGVVLVERAVKFVHHLAESWSRGAEVGKRLLESVISCVIFFITSKLVGVAISTS